MTKEFEFLKAELDSMKENHTWQDIKQLESMQGPSVTVNHQKVIQLSSNNYLGFTSHPRLINAAQEAVQQYGAGTGSVRTIAGTFTMHQELEKKLAAFKKRRRHLYSNQASQQTKAYFQVFYQKRTLSSQMN